MSTRCPSDFGLETYLLDRTASVVGEHLATCNGCTERLARMEQQGQDFRAFVYPATLDRVLDSLEARRPWWRRDWRWVGAPMLAATAAALVLVVGGWPQGGKFSFRVHAGDGSGLQWLEEGARIPVGAPLGYRVVPPDDCHLWVVSVDETGLVSRLLPAQGDRGTFVECDQETPGGVTLGGRPGLERVFAVCGGPDLSWDTVAESVRRSITGGAASLRSTQRLAGLPRRTAQSTLLVEKVQ